MSKIFGYCRISTPKQNIERQERNILKAYPDAMIVKEIFTGSRFQGRRELDKLIKTVKAGDMIIFDSVSRMSRNAEEGFSLYQELYNRGVKLIFLKEPQINTETYKNTLKDKKIDLRPIESDRMANKLMQSIVDALNDYIMDLARKQIQLAFIQSQKEIDDLHQRTREGIETARRNGKQIGQKIGNKLTIKKERPVKDLISKFSKYSKDFGGGNSDFEVIAIINATSYKNPDTEMDERLHISRNTYYKYKREIREKELCI